MEEQNNAMFSLLFPIQIMLETLALDGQLLDIC